jgi:chromosome transmission fidelity protein 1
MDFDFTFEKRNSSIMITELGNYVFGLARTVPDGLVVFFPSYAYLELVVKNWKIPKPDKGSIWDGLKAQKPIFFESKENLKVDDILKEYSQCIEAGKGAMLLSIVGGKMSEGINFSDALGRGVVIVGLPFPNVKSAEWKAKLEYVEQAAVTRGGSTAEGKSAGRDFYENACMRAVNQSIGRAIRHREDYATIVMLDRRYNTDRIQQRLPGWIKNGLVKDASSKKFGDVMESIGRFFKEKSSTG